MALFGLVQGTGELPQSTTQLTEGHITKMLRLTTFNNTIYLGFCFFVIWTIWNLGINWLAYAYGVQSIWYGDHTEFFITQDGGWTRNRITIVQLFFPMLFVIGTLVMHRLSFSTTLRGHRSFISWLYLVLILGTLGILVVGLLLHKKVGYVLAVWAVPQMIWPLLAIPIGVFLALVGKGWVKMIIKAAFHKILITPDYIKDYCRHAILYPYLIFVGTVNLLFIPSVFGEVQLLSIVGLLPVLTANYLGKNRFLIKGTRPKEAQPAIILGFITLIMILMMRVIYEVGWYAFKDGPVG